MLYASKLAYNMKQHFNTQQRRENDPQNTRPYAHKVKNLGLRFRCTITCFAGINQRTGCGRVVDQYTSLCVIYNNAVSSIVFNRTSFSAINFYFVSIATFECIHLIAVKNFQNFFLEHHKLFCFHTQFVNKTPSPKIGKVIRFLLIFLSQLQM